MIDREHSPVGWVLLMHELDDAHEHLGNLLKHMQERSDFDEIEFRIELGHVYAHLNRAWFRRNVHEDFAASERDAAWEIATQFPTDLEPVG